MRYFSMKKILIFILCFSTLFLCFAIPAFADASTGIFEEGVSFTFNDVLDFSSDIFSSEFSFTSNSRFFISISLVEDGSYYTLYYTSPYDEDILVYSQSSGWVDEGYRTILFDESVELTGAARNFFEINVYIAPQSVGIYSTIYELFKTAIFGDEDVTDFANFSLTLISLCLCFAICFLPIIVIFVLLKFFIGTIARY